MLFKLHPRQEYFTPGLTYVGVAERFKKSMMVLGSFLMLAQDVTKKMRRQLLIGVKLRK